MSEKPFISLIVPVYNTEKYLRHCLDSLVYQTYQEIEIIVVDDGSPDASGKIITEYESRFPQLLNSYRIDNCGLSGAREYGLSQAKGEYIYFVDSDDYLNYKACELLAEEAKKYNCDMVYAPIMRIPFSGQPHTYNNITGERSVENVLGHASCSMSAAMYRRDFFLKFCPMPNMWFEDMAFTRVVLSYANIIGFIRQPIYYYVEHEATITSKIFDIRTLDSIKAVNRIVDNCNPSYIDYVSFKAAQRITIDVLERWPFADSFISNAKKQRRFFDTNPKLQARTRVHQNICDLLDLPNEPMPCIVYVGAFGMPPADEFLSSVKGKAFFDGTEIELLNESSCDIHTNSLTEAAYALGNYEFLNSYFALSRILEKGGIFITDSICLESQLNCLRYFESFFSFLTNDTFFGGVFGGRKGSIIIQALLKTYDESFFENPFTSISDRIRNVLVAQGDIRLNGETQIKKNIVAVFSPAVFILPLIRGFHLSEHIIFSQKKLDYKQEQVNISCILKDFLLKFEESAPFFRDTSKGIQQITNDAEAKRLKEELKKEKRKVIGLEEEIRRIKNTISWRITSPIRIVRQIFSKVKRAK